MATPDDIKRQSMDSVSHAETTAQARVINGAASQTVSRPSMAAAITTLGVAGQAAKSHSMSAALHAEMLAHMAAIKFTAGFSLYVAHIRQVDQGAAHRRTRLPSRKLNRVKTTDFGRSHE
jgi:hypothetical protein